MVLVTKKRNFLATKIKKIDNKKTEDLQNEQIHEFTKTIGSNSGTR